jgi:hypothetical protein
VNSFFPLPHWFSRDTVLDKDYSAAGCQFKLVAGHELLVSRFAELLGILTTPAPLREIQIGRAVVTSSRLALVFASHEPVGVWRFVAAYSIH